MPTARPAERPAEDPEQQLGDVLRDHGLRRTAQRSAVLRLLAAAPTENGPREHRHLTATEIHERLRAAGMELDLATVYRTLATLTELGVLHATVWPDQPTCYGLASAAHHHAVCTRCGTVLPIPADALAAALRQVHATTGFDPATSGLTVHGVCPDCQDRSGGPGTA